MRKKYSPAFFTEIYQEELAEYADDEQYQRKNKKEYEESFYRRDCQKATGRFKQQMNLEMEEALADIREERNRM